MINFWWQHIDKLACVLAGISYLIGYCVGISYGKEIGWKDAMNDVRRVAYTGTMPEDDTKAGLEASAKVVHQLGQCWCGGLHKVAGGPDVPAPVSCNICKKAIAICTCSPVK